MGYPTSDTYRKPSITTTFHDNSPHLGRKIRRHTTKEATLDVKSMETSTKSLSLSLGRHAGWIAAAGGLAAERR